MIKALSLTLAAGLAAANVSSADAAGVNRAWVSGHGTDATGCGAPASPCRSFQYVIDNVIAPNGEIDVLDPAGYGAVTIPFAVSIVNDGVGVAGIQAAAGDQAVTIQADASAAVHLRGLTIEGGGVGRIGIQLNSAGSLDIVNSVIRGFSSAGGGDNGNGIELNSTAPCAVTIVDTLISDNGGMGIDFNPRASMTGTLDRITLLNNDGDGVIVRGPSSVTAVRSLATGNANVGFNTNNGFANAAGTPTLTLREVTVTRGVQSFGAGTGIEADAGVIRLAHSVVSGNQVGIAVAGGAVESYGDNDLRDNVTDVTGSLTPVANQ